MLKLHVFIGYITIQKVAVNTMRNFSIKFPLKYTRKKIKFTTAIYIEKHNHHSNSSLPMFIILAL